MGKVKMAGDKIQKAHEQVQQLSEPAVGKILLGVGGSGSLYDYLTDLTGWVDLFIKYGNAAMLTLGLYMAVTNVAHRMKKRRINKRRKTDEV